MNLPTKTLTSKNSHDVLACPVMRLRSFTRLYVTMRLFHLRRIFSTGSMCPLEAISSWTLWKSCERSRVSYRPQRRPTASIRHKTALEEKSEPKGSVFSRGAGDITEAVEAHRLSLRAMESDNYTILYYIKLYYIILNYITLYHIKRYDNI